MNAAGMRYVVLNSESRIHESLRYRVEIFPYLFRSEFQGHGSVIPDQAQIFENPFKIDDSLSNREMKIVLH